MKKGKKVRYTDDKGELGDYEIIPDFLPSPEELARRMAKVKVTLELNETSLEFFKRQAKKHRVPYQRMIRAVVDAYVRHEDR
jgi:predicted DNA binding CopG/RHH family protein